MKKIKILAAAVFLSTGICLSGCANGTVSVGVGVGVGYPYGWGGMGMYGMGTGGVHYGGYWR